MKLTRLSARNFLSFADIDVSLAEPLTVVTGPNGVGKTSIARCVNLIAAAVGTFHQGTWTALEEFAGAGRFGAPQWRVTLGIDFNDGERQLLDDWLRGCLVEALAPGDGADRRHLTDMLLRQHDIGSAALLGQGSVEVDWDRNRRQPWRISWLSDHPTGISTADQHPDAVDDTADGTAAPIRVVLNSNETSVDGDARGPGYAHLVTETIVAAQQRAGMTQDISKAVPDGLLLPTAIDAARRGGVNLAVSTSNSEFEPEPNQRVFDALGIDPKQNQRQVGLAQMLHHFMSRSVLVIDNVRAQPLRMLPVASLSREPHLASGEDLALALLRDKTGDSAARERFQTTQQLYSELSGSGRTLDVTLAGGDGQTSDDVVVTPVVTDGRGDVPLHLSGAGQSEAALLAALLARDVPVLVLDEPATNLSTTAQRRVTSAVQQRASDGLQTIVITHSSNLVPTQDLSSILTLSRGPDGTVAGRVEATAEAVKRVRLLETPAIRDALFATGVLLTEGDSEAAALRVWLADAQPPLEQSGVLLIDVRGEKSLVPHMQILDALRVPWAAFVDGPALHHAFTTYRAVSPPTGEFEPVRDFWAENGVFTVADTYGVDDEQGLGELEAFFRRVDPDLAKRVAADNPKSKPRAALDFALAHPRPASIDDIWARVVSRITRGASS